MTNQEDEYKRQLERRLHNSWDGQRRKKRNTKGLWYQIFLILAAVVLIAAMVYMLVTI